MRHDRLPPQTRRQSLLTRKRFQFAGALVVGALLPWFARGPLLPGQMFEAASLNSLIGNSLAVVIAFWLRLSIETYPGIRRTSVILPSALAGHGSVVAWCLLTRFPYDRVGLAAGFILHIVWLYGCYMYAERNTRRRIAIIPFGRSENPVTKTNWEGRGVQPDVAAPASAALGLALQKLRHKPGL